MVCFCSHHHQVPFGDDECAFTPAPLSYPVALRAGQPLELTRIGAGRTGVMVRLESKRADVDLVLEARWVSSLRIPLTQTALTHSILVG